MIERHWGGRVKNYIERNLFLKAFSPKIRNLCESTECAYYSLIKPYLHREMGGQKRDGGYIRIEKKYVYIY